MVEEHDCLLDHFYIQKTGSGKKRDVNLAKTFDANIVA
jgi:hypothetical protein